MSRLTLNTVGIRSPAMLDVAPAEPEPASEHAPRAETPESTPSSRSKSRATRASTTTRPPSPEELEPLAERPFFGLGRRVQTSMMLEPELAEQVRQLAAAASVSFNALLVAVVEYAFPLDDSTVRQLLREDDRSREPGVETNVRMPLALRARLDETVGALPSGARVARAHLINALLRRDLPSNAHQASERVLAFQRRAAHALLT